MSTIGDALAALKNVVFMQERLDVMRAEQKRIADDVLGLSTYVQTVDRHLVRIETMVEMSSPRGAPPRIEG